ncbi:hypothetical protein LSG31_10635 [Fodinisporobacter ferrooxydans]|uniref:Lipoprotein n=1 Tax=Fodinisporobacter ferrooxydans TaxID=2901836 RepID=A0ABY4CPZ3_9BACL|nr:hypothetical protein LSG31_10635 [Alicyclobacillaceae bacterium MYW30-H2]
MNKLFKVSLLLPFLVLAGCSNSKVPNTNVQTKVNIPWSSVSKSVQNVTYALESMYNGKPDQTSNNIQVKQKSTDNQTYYYLISITGKFLKQGVKKSASDLSFSILEDGTKVWGLVAKDDAGNIVWQNNDLSVLPSNIQFIGHSENWKGVYDLSGAKVWNKNFSLYGIWEEHQFKLTYIGANPQTVPHLKYTVKSTGGSFSYENNNVDLHKVITSNGAGAVLFPGKNDTLTTTVDWGKQTENFELNATAK